MDDDHGFDVKRDHATLWVDLPFSNHVPRWWWMLLAVGVLCVAINSPVIASILGMNYVLQLQLYMC